MARLLFVSCCLSLMSLPSRPTFAEAPECAHLRTSKVPFQINVLDQDDSVVPYQVYRIDDLYKQQISKKGSKLYIVGMQANFPLVFMGLTGKTTYTEWSVPTSKYFFDAGITKARAVTRVEGKQTSDVEQTFTLLGEEPVTIGRCTFMTKHYKVEYDRKTGMVRSEFWLSPELQAALRWKHDIATSDGKTRPVSAQAVSIQMDFIPFH